MKNIFTKLSIAILFFAIVACDKSDEPEKIIEQPVGKNYRIKSMVTHRINPIDESVSPDSLLFTYEDEKLVRTLKIGLSQDEWKNVQFSSIQYVNNIILFDQNYISNQDDTIMMVKIEYVMVGNKIKEFIVHPIEFNGLPLSNGSTDEFIYNSQDRLILIQMTGSEGEDEGQTKISYVNDKIATRGLWNAENIMVSVDTFFYENEKLLSVKEYRSMNSPIEFDRKIVYSYNSKGQINKIDFWGPDGDYWGNRAFTYNEDGLLIKVETEDKGEIVEEVFYEYEEGEGNAEFFEFDNMYYNFDEMPTYTRKDNTKPELGRPGFRLSPLKF